ncbi:MAG: hypothetical protein ABJF23_10455 [Bryobacteraceae bacterium]
MADQLFLSYRLRGYTENNMLRHFEKMLRVFPFSRLDSSGSVLRVSAVSWDEPPLLELALPDPVDIDAALASAKEFTNGDCAVQLEAKWDLWQYDKEWEVKPARVVLSCFGPRFEGEDADHLRIDLGLDVNFLPQTEFPNSAFMAQSNIRSLLHLAAELDRTLNVENKRLWSDSGENFADQLQWAVESTLQ